MSSPTTVPATTKTSLEDPRYKIHHDQPSKEVTDRFGNERSYHSFNAVFDRPAGFGIVGASGFIGEFILRHLPAEESKIIGCTVTRDATKKDEKRISLGLREDQIVNDYQDLIKNPTVDVIVVATDNASHYEIAKAALENGKHVICEKPVAISSNQAQELKDLAETMGLDFTLNHFYSQYTQVANIAALVAAPKEQRILTINPFTLDPALNLGSDPIRIELGDVVAVEGIYDQDWVLDAVRSKVLAHDKVAALDAGTKRLPADFGIWRLNPKNQGLSCAFGDIGVHLVEVLSYVLGCFPEEKVQSSSLTKVVNSSYTDTERNHDVPLDVEANVELNFTNGVPAFLRASQIRQGTANDLSISVEFQGATISWSNRDANCIFIQSESLPCGALRLERGRDPLVNLSADGMLLETVVQGHDQGHGHAQSHALRLFLDRICRNQLAAQGKEIKGTPAYLPGANLGVAEMKVIEQVVAVAA